MRFRFHYVHLVKGVPRASYKGFVTLDEAQGAFVIAYTLGFVEAIPARGSVDFGLRPATASLVTTNPSQNEILATLSGTSRTFLGTTWYAVFKGIRPGVYPSW